MKRTFVDLHFETGAVHPFELMDGRFVIGSDAKASFVIKLDVVAAHHVAFVVSPDSLAVEPLAHGVYVNGQKITEPVMAEFPASVEIPGVTMLLRQEEAAEPDPIPAEPLPEPTPEPISDPAPVDPNKTTIIPRRPAAGANPPAAPTPLDPNKTITVHPRKNSAPADPNATIVVERRREASGFEGGSDFAPLRGGFRLGKEIARGGMGRIHLGTDAQLKREVAIKISHENGIDPRFSREAEVLARLAHPNIVPVIALGADNDGRPYYAMKLVKGRTLQDIIRALRDGDARARRDFPLPTLLTIYRKVCDAMAFAHSQRILHRDLKPENIMVGEYGEVLVMDWGLAKLLDSPGEDLPAPRVGTSPTESGSFDKTLDGEVMGSPYYMPPEQAQGKIHQLNETSDIYSLGAILYALLSLHPPIDGKTLEEILTKVKSGQITPMTTSRRGRAGREPGTPAAMDRHIPEALQAVTKKAMATLQLHRYHRVEDLAADIDSYQRGFATKAENASALRQVVLLVKRHKAASSLIALFFVALALFTLRLAASERTARANEEKAIANEEKSRRKTAEALVSAAEAAEDANDSEAMREALFQVPEDLRDKTWKYLLGKSDEVDMKLTAPGGGPVMTILEFPGKTDAFLVAQNSGEISQLDSKSGQFLPLMKASETGCSLKSIAISPDGAWLALCWQGNDGSEKITLARAGSGVDKWKSAPNFGTIELPKGTRIDSLQLTPAVVLALDGDRKLSAYSIETGKLLWERNDVRTFSVSRDNLQINVLNMQGKLDRLSAADGQLISEGQVARASIWFLFFMTPDGNTAFSCSSSLAGITQSGDLQNGGLRWQTRSVGKTPFALAWSAQTNLLGVMIQGSAIGAIMEMRDANSGTLKRSHKFVCVQFNRDQFNRVFACNRSSFAFGVGREVYLWKWQPSQPTMKIKTVARHFFALLAGGGKLAESNRKEFVLADISDSKAGRKNLPIDKIPLCGRYIDTDRKGVRIVVNEGADVTAYRLVADKIQEVWPTKKSQSRAGASNLLHPTEDLFWIGNQILAFSTGKPVATLDFQKNGVASLVLLNGCCSKSGAWVGADHLVTPAVLKNGDQQQRSLVLWNAKTGEAVAKVPAPQVSALVASPDGQWIAEGGADKRLRIRSGKNLKLQTEFRAQDGPITGLAWHPRLPILATASGNSVRLWNTKTWEMLEEIQLDNTSDEPTFLDIPGDEGHRLFVTVGVELSIFEPASFQKKP